MRCRFLSLPAFVAVFVAVAGLLPEAVANAQEKVVAFGDSITFGAPFDEANAGGYPRRLQRVLRRGGRPAEVVNEGVSGERTSGGLSRIGSVLAKGGDVFLLMEGTNDIPLVASGVLSIEAVRSNLNTMANRAEAAGFETYIATIIPRGPNASVDRSSFLTNALVLEIRELAFQTRRPLADAWEAFPLPSSYASLYNRDPGDRVGHPNAAGFDVLAETFGDILLDRDTVGPVVGQYSPNPGVVPVVRGGQRFELVLYDFGDGIDRDTATLTIHGEPVETETTGNRRRLTLKHTASRATLGCNALIGFVADDDADPPNTSMTVVAEHSVPGGEIRASDLNRDCRVDGTDLLTLAFGFGARQGNARYFTSNDINRDGIIDGTDLARIARDFGRTTE